MLRKFEVVANICLSSCNLKWPDKDSLRDDSGLGGNRSFSYISRPTWGECREVLFYEAGLLARLQSLDSYEEYIDDDDELMARAERIGGLDEGVASVVYCLAALGCIPFTSCNGGIMGDHHLESHPLVAFYCKEWHVDFLVRCAVSSGVGLVGQEGAAVVYSGDVFLLLDFARKILKEKSSIGREKKLFALKANPPVSSGQMEIPLE